MVCRNGKGVREMKIKQMIAGASTAAVMMGLVAVPALAGAGKSALYDAPGNFTCATGAQPADGEVTFGFATVNANKHGMLEVEVSVKGATPNATYDVWVNQDPGACPLPAATAVGAVTTNTQGNGNAHVKVAAVDGASNYWVSVVGGGQVLRSMAVQTP